MKTKIERQKILSLDPGTKEMGIAVLQGFNLLDYRVKTFRNEKSIRQLLSQGKETMDQLLETLNPEIVVIERPFFSKTRRSALLTFLVEELRIRTRRSKSVLSEYGAREAREILLGDSKATKRDVAEYVVQLFPELQRHFHPGDFWREKYWSHVFDAVALGLAELKVRTSR